MSANRSVQAAQRRRAGPTNEPGIPGRGPQPSINSAQLFANQQRPGQGPNIPTGRLAGQQAAMQQQQMQQQQLKSQQQQQTSQNDKLASVSKMTIPQAITLITLRLGALESKMMNSSDGHNINLDGESGIDADFLKSIITRLDALEKRPALTGSGSNSELNLLKQQFIQLKTSSVKETVFFKTQLENMRKELTETTELLAALQNLAMDNSQKILNISMGTNFDSNLLDDFTGLSDFTGLPDGLPDGFLDNATSLQELNDLNLNLNLNESSSEV